MNKFIHNHQNIKYNSENKIPRRAALLGLATTFTLGRSALALTNAPGQRRLVVVLLRGAMDGLAAVVPYGDRDLAALRGAITPRAVGEPGGLRDLGGFYGLNPALAALHAMYAGGEALVLHAIAGQYRTRSHFDGQDYLESGADRRLDSGWLNRAVAAMPGARVEGEALAVGVVLPLLLRGPAHAANWAPAGFATPTADLYARIAELHQSDPLTGKAIAIGLRERGMAGAALAGTEMDPNRSSFPALAAAAGRLLRAADGPRVAAMELGGWDTHNAQNARLPGALKQLDAGLGALKSALGDDAWKQTAVLVMTEFGRTVRPNGTAGTDHGTASAAFLLGGAVAGGRVLADWPGLRPAALLDNRDLMPTADLRAVAMGVLTQHLRVPVAAMGTIFPGAAALAARSGLIRQA